MSPRRVKPDELYVVPMYEFEGGPKPMQFYSRGHHDKMKFIEAVAMDKDPWTVMEHEKIARNAEHFVRHEYWRATPTGLEECPFTYMVAERGYGAFKVTVVDM